MPHSSICIMDLPALRIIPFLHGNGLARLRARPCWHINGLASSTACWPMAILAGLRASRCWHGADIGTDNVKTQCPHCRPRRDRACGGIKYPVYPNKQYALEPKNESQQVFQVAFFSPTQTWSLLRPSSVAPSAMLCDKPFQLSIKLPATDKYPRITKLIFDEWQEVWNCCAGNKLHAAC